MAETLINSDHQLIEAARSGDHEAFRKLVVKYEGKVAAIIQSLIGNIPEAEDLGQEVFLQAYASLNRFQQESDFELFLLRNSVQQVIPVLKRKVRQEYKRQSDPVEDIRQAEYPMDKREIFQYIFNHLDPPLQIVLTLRLMIGYSLEKTAQILNESKETVLEKLSLAQYQVRSALEETMK